MAGGSVAEGQSLATRANNNELKYHGHFFRLVWSSPTF